MNFSRQLFILLALISLNGYALAQGRQTDFPNYELGSLSISSTPGTQGGAAAGFWNPGAWSAMNGWEASFSWNDHNLVQHHMDDWGLFLGGSGLGFAMKRASLLDSMSGRHSFIEDYQISIGGGNSAMASGLAYGWSKGRTDWLHRDQYLTWGSLYRPVRCLSLGGAASLGLDRGDYRGIVDAGVRPLGNHRITAFGDAAFGRLDNASTMQWGAGVEMYPVDGVRVAFKLSKPYADVQDKIISVGLGLAIDNTGVQVVPHYNKDSDLQSTSYLLRLSNIVPDFSTRRLYKKDNVVAVGMKGTLTYQKARWFDKDKIAFYQTLQMIDDAKRDPGVGGIALNLSGLRASRELLWELRRKLADFKSAGKHVYVYIDNIGMSGYYLASVADYVWIDPEGMITMQGYVAGRTFMKNFLAKIGLGVEEWRFFTYKSAFESLARDNMSEPDKEQRLVLIQDFFENWVQTVAESRTLSADKIRSGVDTLGILTAEDALAFGLVDSVGTWDDTPEFIEHVTGSSSANLISQLGIEAYPYEDPQWGPRPEIAIVYAVGESDMDTGFKGRYTSRLLRKLGKDNNVKAIILRADSPGGDAMAADMIARQMKEISEKKPVIVSQGDVAASGGYWISMYGHPIFASPYSITGSIGVIGGWVWNDGFSGKTGFTSDHVQVGEHADVGFGVTLPLIGAQIPDRNLDVAEHARMEKLIRGMYADFTKKVAEGRGLEQSYVDSVGQGRVWSGTRAKDLNLVDKIGGLEEAIADARQQTHLTGQRHVAITEYPHASWFSFDEVMAPMSPIGILARLIPHHESAISPSWREDYEWRVIKRMAKAQGRPLLMVPPEDIPRDE